MTLKNLFSGCIFLLLFSGLGVRLYGATPESPADPKVAVVDLQGLFWKNYSEDLKGSSMNPKSAGSAQTDQSPAGKLKKKIFEAIATVSQGKYHLVFDVSGVGTQGLPFLYDFKSLPDITAAVQLTMEKGGK
jgi:hypothetical protein